MGFCLFSVDGAALAPALDENWWPSLDGGHLAAARLTWSKCLSLLACNVLMFLIHEFGLVDLWFERS